VCSNALSVNKKTANDLCLLSGRIKTVIADHWNQPTRCHSPIDGLLALVFATPQKRKNASVTDTRPARVENAALVYRDITLARGTLSRSAEQEQRPRVLCLANFRVLPKAWSAELGPQGQSKYAFVFRNTAIAVLTGVDG